MTLDEQIKAACDSTPPKTKARMDAPKAIRWVLRDPNGNYVGLDGAEIVAVEDVKDAAIFDGRDNEELKHAYYSRVTSLDYTVELL